MNLFNKYIKKELFSNILSFLPKIYLISKKLICKNWYEILTCNFTKKALNLLDEPCKIYYSSSFRTYYDYIFKINNSLYRYSYPNEYVYEIDSCIHNVTGYGNLIWFKDYNGSNNIHKTDSCVRYVIGYGNLIWCKDNNITISDSNGKRNIEWNNKDIRDMTTDGKDIYILSYDKIFDYDTNGKFIKEWNISNSYYGKIVVDNGEIYVSRSYEFIYVYSNDGELIRIINTNDFFSYFDIYKNYIYTASWNSDKIRVLTKEGKIIYCKDCNTLGMTNLFVINNTIYIVKHEIVDIYKIKYY